MKTVEATQKRNAVGGAKVIINAVIALIVTIALVLSSFFLFGGLSVKLSDWAFWTQKIISGLATFVIMIAISNITEEIARKKDNDLNSRLSALDGHYQDIMRNYETDNLETFLTNINKANKYKAYLSKLKRKLKHARRDETKAKIHALLLVDADELWNSETRVKYNKVTYNQMVSGAFDVSATDDECDLNVHKAKYGAQKFGWKIISIIACGGLVGDMVYSYADFTKAMVVPLIFKIATILIAVYSGVCFGYFIIERTKTVTKGKLRLFSKFRARVNDTTLTNENRFDVAISTDIIVEKIRAQKALETAELAKAEQPTTNTETNLLRKTYEDTFGNNQPVKASGFFKKFIDNAIQYELDK